MAERCYGSKNCIICGRENPAGLRVEYHAEAGRSRAEVVPPERFQGFDGTLHGGIVSGILDDAMWYACYSAGHFTMTAELTVRFKRPVPVAEPLAVEGRVVSQRGRLLQVEAALTHAGSGEVLAEASAKFLTVSEEMKQRLASTAIEGLEG